MTVEILRWAITLWLAALMIGLSGFSVYAALFTVPKDDTPLAGRVLRYLGFGLVWTGVALIAGGILGAGIVGALRAFGV